MIAANAAFATHRLSATAVGLLFTGLTMWIGVACYINGRRCGRTHCMIVGYLLPPLSVFGLLNMVGIASIRWQTYFRIFLLIVIASLVLECCGGKYTGRGMRRSNEQADSVRLGARGASYETSVNCRTEAHSRRRSRARPG
jgi:hypothetical protein